MSKVIYQIETKDGCAREGWDRIVCDVVQISDFGVIKFYVEGEFDRMIYKVYKLAEGESLIYCGKEQ